MLGHDVLLVMALHGCPPAPWLPGSICPAFPAAAERDQGSDARHRGNCCARPGMFAAYESLRLQQCNVLYLAVLYLVKPGDCTYKTSVPSTSNRDLMLFLP